MAKIYTYNLSIDDLSKLQLKITDMIKLITDNKFKEYIGKRMEEALIFIQRELLNTTPTVMNYDLTDDLSNYMNSNHLEISGDTIYIYNDATIDVASKKMKETTKARYPAQLSLAKIIEYGIGYVGGTETTNLEEVEDWQYDVNGHGIEGWYYVNDNGEVRWTNGFAGRLIFYHLKEFIEKSINTWIKEYMNENL